MYAKHNLRCWIEECGGTTSGAFYPTPEPHLTCHKCKSQKWNLTDEDIELILNTDNNLYKLYAKDTEAKGNNLKIDREGLFPQRGIIAPMDNRCISKETAEKYGVETLFSPEGTPEAYSFPAYNDDGECVAQKVKRFDKKMKWLYGSDKMPSHLMFGQNLFPKGGRFITLTEGEEDAQAVYQMLKAASPAYEPVVVSLFNGASTAERDCQKQWEYINSFENIIIAFDGDEEGKKAAEKVAKLFHFRPKIILFGEARKNKEGVWEWKDGNDYLKGKREKDFVNLWWRAEKFTPKGVKTFGSLWDDMIKKDTNTVVPFPWKGMNEKLRGLVTGQLVVVKAPPKVGKTSVLKEIIYNIYATSPHNVGIVFLENTKKEIGVGLCALHLNKNIKPWEIPEDLAELQNAHLELSKDDRLTVFDPEDSRAVDNVLAKILYFVKAHNCRYIFLDHITMLSYQSEDENERRFLDKLCADLKELTTSLDVCLVIVTHVNDDGKTRGSRASVQLCDVMISLERDKTNTDPIMANTTDVVIEDNRWGECGLACKLFYDQDTGRMTQLDTDLTIDGFDK